MTYATLEQSHELNHSTRMDVAQFMATLESEGFSDCDVVPTYEPNETESEQ